LPHLIGKFSGRKPIEDYSPSVDGVFAGWLHCRQHVWILRDQTGHLELPRNSFLEAPECDGNYWAVLKKKGSSWRYLLCQTLTTPSPYGGDDRQFKAQKDRFEIIEAIRQFFRKQGFQDVDTPIQVPCPGLEAYLDAFSSGNKHLRTSPELHMKRLLCSGWDRIFQIAPSFRDEPESNLHRQEFLMLEWYRSFSDLEQLIIDIRKLLHHLAPFSKEPEYFKRGIQLWTMTQLFETKTGIDLRNHNSESEIRQFLSREKIHHCDSDTWDDLFFRVFLNVIEPSLGDQRPEIIMDYPASQSALAKINPKKEGHYQSCYRFELFMKGIECANAFYELCDPVEQQSRFDQARMERMKNGKEPFPPDVSFMEALQAGMPPSAGIALGVDRLIMLLLEKNHIDSISPFNVIPEPETDR